MTPEELRDIDRKVAEAIGLKLAHHNYQFHAVTESPHGLSASTECCDYAGWGMYYWRPSVDWNDAMFAAEKAGLFDAHEEYCDDIFRLSRGWDGWDAIRFADPYTSGNSHISGPLAICQCILRFKGKA